MENSERISSHELADRLDAVLPPDQDTIPSGAGDPLIAAAIEFARESSRYDLSPEALERIESKVLQANRALRFQRRAVPQITVLALQWAAAAAIVLFGIGVTLAVGHSVPSDAFYPVKRGVERFEIALATSDATLSSVHLSHAERRLEEASILLERGEFDSDLIIAALGSLGLSANAARQTLPEDLPPDLLARTAQVNATIDTVLQAAKQAGMASPSVVQTLAQYVQVLRDDGTLLLPSETPSVASVPVLLPTPIPEPRTPIPMSVTGPTATPLPSVPPRVSPAGAGTESHVSAHTPVTVAPPTAVAYAVYNVEVYRGPGTQYDIIATLRPGDSAEIIGEDASGEWQQIRLSGSRLGWVEAYRLTTNSVLTRVPYDWDSIARQPGEDVSDDEQQPGRHRDVSGKGGNAIWQSGDVSPGCAFEGPRGIHDPGQDNGIPRGDSSNNGKGEHL